MRILRKATNAIKKNKWWIITGALCAVMIHELDQAGKLNEELRTKNEDLERAYEEFRREQFNKDMTAEGDKMRLREICRKYNIMESFIEKQISTEDYAEFSKALGFAYDPVAESWVKNIHS